MAGFLLPPGPIRSLDEHLATETGGLGLRRATDVGPAATIAEITASGLRGRGGAGFPTGRKWQSVASQTDERRYLVCNAAEGEPATFKDRALMRANPYQLVEGIVIAAFALDATGVFIGLKASDRESTDCLMLAITEMQREGICRDCAITVVHGPDEYLFGEEKAMLEVIEGRSPLPRLAPPYEHGLFATDVHTGWEGSGPGPAAGRAEGANPTVVNNVETLCNVPHILAKGADWFRSFGTERSPGTVVCTVVGDVRRHGVAEVELGTPLDAAISMVSEGALVGHSIKAVVSGVSNAVIPGDSLGVALTYEDLADLGSGLGAAGFFVVDERTCMVELARQLSRFLWVESCGQCPACKGGSGEITERLDRVEAGIATELDLRELDSWLAKVTDGNRCFLAVEERNVVASILAAFPGEVTEHLELGHCPRPYPVPLPKILDIRDGIARYDERHLRKRPDWTYAEDP